MLMHQFSQLPVRVRTGHFAALRTISIALREMEWKSIKLRCMTIIAALVISLVAEGSFMPVSAQDRAGAYPSLISSTRVISKDAESALDQWIEALYDDSYLPGSLLDTSFEGHRAIFLSFIEDGNTGRAIVVDFGGRLILHSNFDATISDEEMENALRGFIESRVVTSSSCEDTYKCNCVLYVKYCKGVPLPSGLTTWKAKLKIINSSVPIVGAVAIIDTTATVKEGHVAYVQTVNPDGTITIDEANYHTCEVGQRTGTPQALKVVGYYVVPGTAPAPTISQVTPNQVTLNIPTWLDVYGANINSAFTAGVRVGSTVYPIASAGLSYINSGHVRVNVNMGGTSGYSAQVVITNPDGQSASGGFNVVH